MPTTTVAPIDSILILNTAISSNIPVLTDATGQIDSDLAFTLDENTSVWRSCSVVVKNQHYAYGGDGYAYGNYKRQISRIDGCRLRRIGDLPFDHEYGTCTTVIHDMIFLCFHAGSESADHKRCRYASQPEGPFFGTFSLSKWEHQFARIAASSGKFILYYRNELVTT